QVSPAPPLTTTATTTSTASTRLILVTNMVFITPSVRAATLPGITPVTACPAAKRFETLIVDATSAGGADAADPADNTAAADPPENTTPRWVSRFASIPRARASRLATLP